MKKCQFCAEEIQDDAIMCRYCKSDLRPQIITPQNSPSNSNQKTKTSSETSDQIQYMQLKKSIGIAILLNVLWAGWGIYYSKAQEGKWIAGVNIIAFLLSFVMVGVPCLILCIWASVICSNHIEVYNLELQQAIKEGKMSAFNNKYL